MYAIMHQTALYNSRIQNVHKQDNEHLIIKKKIFQESHMYYQDLLSSDSS